MDPSDARDGQLGAPHRPAALPSDGPVNRPSSLRDAIQASSRHIEGFGPPSESASEEDYDEQSNKPPVTLLLRRRGKQSSPADGPKRANGTTNSHPTAVLNSRGSSDVSIVSENSSFEELQTLNTSGLASRGDTQTFVVTADDKEFREVLRRASQRAKDPGSKHRRGKFSDLVFTRQFSTFDRQNEDAANSPFHGFYTLFWLAVALFMLKIAAENWRMQGNPLGTNEIMKSMFRRDVLVLGLSDGLLCGLTGVSWVLQKLIFMGYIDWDRQGWIIQNIWQTAFLAGFIGLTLVRDWPWTHTVFFVLHGLVMLMKQHSYAFYNGYLSSVYKQRNALLSKLKTLENVAPVVSPSATSPPAASISTSHLRLPPSAAEMKERRQSLSVNAGPDGTDIDRIATAIESGQPLDSEQVHVFERIIKWEVIALSNELQGKAATPDKAYPNNLTLANYYEYIVLPTVVYELAYPRSDSINWFYVAEKVVATFGIIFVMIMLSQKFICKHSWPAPCYSHGVYADGILYRPGRHGSPGNEGGRSASR
jgi:sterol O-acyltransferase